VNFLSVDYGGAVLGWAWWSEGSLFACGLSRSKSKDCRQRAHDHKRNITAALGFWPDVVVVEMGDWRGKTTKRKMTPQQLADFNLGVGFLGTLWYSVAEWKGGTPREQEQLTTRATLTEKELALLDAVRTKEAHNACSAVGIGLHHLKRAHGPRSEKVWSPVASRTKRSIARSRPATSAGTTSAKKRKTAGAKSPKQSDGISLSGALVPGLNCL
jgi:hypothetical protein